mmetsp:Transcript_16919/g.34816  ORF Transcript_16919/g.34816 Transcript_16919/m.34816 type:complete len:216 (+) Transcript_16919:1451-2098(+)
MYWLIMWTTIPVSLVLIARLAILASCFSTSSFVLGLFKFVKCSWSMCLRHPIMWSSAYLRRPQHLSTCGFSLWNSSVASSTFFSTMNWWHSSNLVLPPGSESFTLSDLCVRCMRSFSRRLPSSRSVQLLHILLLGRLWSYLKSRRQLLTHLMVRCPALVSKGLKAGVFSTDLNCPGVQFLIMSSSASSQSVSPSNFPGSRRSEGRPPRLGLLPLL